MSLPEIVIAAAVVLLCEIEPPPLPTVIERVGPKSKATAPVSLKRAPPLNSMVLVAAALPRLAARVALAMVPPERTVFPLYVFGPESVKVLAPDFSRLPGPAIPLLAEVNV